MVATVGCASKNYVKSETTPLINKTNELDDLTAKNSKDIKDVDARVQAGLATVNAKTDSVEQKAQTAGQNAAAAQQVADAANTRVGVLTNTVANLDNYHAVAETSVKFGFNKDNLTPKSKEALDQLAASIASTKGYIVALEGGTDSVGPADYNYDLSQRRANAVIQYLATKFNVPAHKIYVIGLGKDKPVETNKTSTGRADNRRVDVRLMTNSTDTTAPAATPTAAGQANPSSM
jgi:outer membrane protein OmpA-like peptidoglycan-associated protein